MKGSLEEDEAAEYWRIENERNREHSERLLVSVMISSGYLVVPKLDEYSKWLLVGAASVGSFLIVNADNVLRVLPHWGYLLCGMALAASCVSGLIARRYALKAIVASDAAKGAVLEAAKVCQAHEANEAIISDGLAKLGLPQLDTEIRMVRVLDEVIRILPWWGSTHVRKMRTDLVVHGSLDPQRANLVGMGVISRLSIAVGCQMALFIVFLLAGFISASIHQLDLSLPSGLVNSIC